MCRGGRWLLTGCCIPFFCRPHQTQCLGLLSLVPFDEAKVKSSPLLVHFSLPLPFCQTGGRHKAMDVAGVLNCQRGCGAAVAASGLTVVKNQKKVPASNHPPIDLLLFMAEHATTSHTLPTTHTQHSGRADEDEQRRGSPAGAGRREAGGG
jgi:hypothetical protein